ncbi:MAG TPA: PadR family transcriptional regulator [Candidatus Glassbacteria bacterium]|nr:PadR family transcriptional regulator [Candidatus Glassbacteria bacterium]
MAKFKDSGDLTRTLILGMLSGGQMHGYEIKKRIQEALGKSADINFGSIYYGLKSLTANGLVDHLRDEPGKGSPERSIYRITPKGRKHLAQLLESSLADLSLPLRPLEVGLHFMDNLPSDKAWQLLQDSYNNLSAQYEKSLNEELSAGEPQQARFIREYRLYQLGAEVRWLKNLLAHLN